MTALVKEYNRDSGRNTCRVALTHGKSAAEIKKGEKLACIIALGYGAAEGIEHKNHFEVVTGRQVKS